MECNDIATRQWRSQGWFESLCCSNLAHLFGANTFPFMIVALKYLLSVLQVAFLVLSVTVKLARPKELDKFTFRHVLIFAQFLADSFTMV
jgi:hypothetical protein